MAAVVPRDFMPEKLNPDANTHRSRLHGARQVFQEMPTGTLADEILTPGEGQIRALIVIGGNPVMSWPDQAKTLRALESLDLLVTIDVRHSDTVDLADYFLPASYGLERPELTAYNDYLYNQPFVQFAEPVVDPPGEAREEWVYLAELARAAGHLDRAARWRGRPRAVPQRRADFFHLLYPEAPPVSPLAEMMEHEGGKVFEQFAGPRSSPSSRAWTIASNSSPRASPRRSRRSRPTTPASKAGSDPTETSPHLMTCRRNGLVYNSMCHELPRTATSNPAHSAPR